MEDFCSQIGQVAHDINNEWLNDANVVCEARDEGSEEAVDHSDESATNRHQHEVAQTRQHIDRLDVARANLTVLLEQVVQNLKTATTDTECSNTACIATCST